MKKAKKWVLLGIAALILLIVAANSVFIVEEYQSALVLRFGDPQGIFVNFREQGSRTAEEQRTELYRQLAEDGENIPVRHGAGLRFKVPFVDNVVKYDARLITYTVSAHEVITQDRKKLIFDNNAQWQIENPLRFFRGLREVYRAESRISDRLTANMNIIIGRSQSTQIITEKEESREVMRAMTEAVNADSRAERFGIYIVDIRIKRTDLPLETHESIFHRMNTERQQIAAEHRARGDEEYIRIKSQTDREVVTITSEATREAEEIKGEADQEAARIFNEAYGANPEFFEFYNLLDTYRATVGSGSTMVVPLNSPFARYLLGVEMNMPGTQVPPAAPPAGDDE